METVRTWEDRQRPYGSLSHFIYGSRKVRSEVDSNGKGSKLIDEWVQSELRRTGRGSTGAVPTPSTKADETAAKRGTNGETSALIVECDVQDLKGQVEPQR